MNKKIKFLAILLILNFCEQTFLYSKDSKDCKHNKVNKDNKNKDLKKSKNSKESRINDFFDPYDDNNIKLDNAFKEPSKLTIWLRQLGLGILFKYHSFKNWLKNIFNK